MVKKILIVEDDSALCDILTNIIETSGYEVASTFSAVDGLKRAKNRNMDLIILYIDLPDMDGMTMLQLLKTTPETKDIPVLMSSANDMVVSVEKAYRLGAKGYILKPFKKELILKKIKEIIGEPK